MKSYTDLEQSKKLAEFLPIESADMYYDDMVDHVTGELFVPHDGSSVKVGKRYAEYLIPCWSLATLLDILPETIEDKWGEYDLKIDMIYKKPEYLRLGDCSHSDFPSWDWDNEELLDNIVEAVIWLNNNGYLRDEKLY